MGLDINFAKAKRTEWKRFQKDLATYESLPVEEQTEDNNPYNNLESEEIGYFRKVNFLVRFFDYEENCELKEISKDKLKELRLRCVEISQMEPVRTEVSTYPSGGLLSTKIYSEADQKRCAELLPTQAGFFFGSTDYNEWYFDDVKEVLVWVDGVLNDLADDEVILMYCWW